MNRRKLGYLLVVAMLLVSIVVPGSMTMAKSDGSAVEVGVLSG